MPHQPHFEIQFVIDTGFTDYLCLPTEAVAVMGLPFLYDLQANLANNSNVILPVHQATIIWLKREPPVRVLATGRRPLLGTSWLDRAQLTIQFTQPGFVTIESLES